MCRFKSDQLSLSTAKVYKEWSFYLHICCTSSCCDAQTQRLLQCSTVRTLSVRFRKKTLTESVLAVMKFHLLHIPHNLACTELAKGIRSHCWNLWYEVRALRLFFYLLWVICLCYIILSMIFYLLIVSCCIGIDMLAVQYLFTPLFHLWEKQVCSSAINIRYITQDTQKNIEFQEILMPPVV